MSERVIKPMLAKDGDLSKITYPVVAQPKLDGIRCLIVDGVARSRTFKPIPNQEIQAVLGCAALEGLDGELIVGEPSAANAMQATTSFVMAPNKTGESWCFYVFDKWDHAGDFEARWEAALDQLAATHATYLDTVRMVANTTIEDADELALYESEALEGGFEGIIVRDPRAPYKHGRSGVKGPLLKVKRFIDFEARIVGVYELMHNGNEAKKDAFGRTERSTVKANKTGLNALGGFELVAINGPHEGQSFRCGTGFDRDQRIALWAAAADSKGLDPPHEMDALDGKVVKIKSFPVGVKDAPRFPVFLGFRNMEVDG